MRNTIKRTKDPRIYANTMNVQEFTFQIPTENNGYRLGVLILGDGATLSGAGVYLMCIGTTAQNTINLLQIHKGNTSRTITATIIGSTITISANAIIYGGIRIIWLG